jgi:hypothetical protein
MNVAGRASRFSRPSRRAFSGGRTFHGDLIARLHFGNGQAEQVRNVRLERVDRGDVTGCEARVVSPDSPPSQHTHTPSSFRFSGAPGSFHTPSCFILSISSFGTTMVSNHRSFTRAVALVTTPFIGSAKMQSLCVAGQNGTVSRLCERRKRLTPYCATFAHTPLMLRGGRHQLASDGLGRFAEQRSEHAPRAPRRLLPAESRARRAVPSAAGPAAERNTGRARGATLGARARGHCAAPRPHT